MSDMSELVSVEWLAKNVVGLSEDEYREVRRRMIYETRYEPSAVDLLGALSGKES